MRCGIVLHFIFAQVMLPVITNIYNEETAKMFFNIEDENV